MKKKITSIVTGGYGFIGSHLVELLIKKNHDIIIIDDLSSGKLENIENNKKIKLIKRDINSINYNHIFFHSKIDYIFHFAGIGDVVPSIDSPEKYIQTNVNGTMKILGLAKKLKIKKFIYAASSSCYGINNNRINEKAKINIEHPYALSKYYGEQLVIHWSKFYKIPFISMRIFNAYGLRSRTSGAYGAVLGVFLRQSLANKPLTIVGDGKQKRDFIHVKDVASAFYKAAVSNKKNQIYNLGSDNPISIRYLASKISNKLTYIKWRPGEPTKTHANISKIQNDLKWKPIIKFDDGINEIIRNIKHWKNAPLWTEAKIKKATKNWFKFLK